MICQPCVPPLPPRLWSSLLAALVFSAASGVVGPAQTLDPGFDPDTNAEVFALAVQTDGKILAGGSFTLASGQVRSRLARFNPDGSLDPAFNPAASASVQAFALQPDGRILVGGTFTTLAGSARVRLARLQPDGSLDQTFVAGADALVTTLQIQPDGRILAGGMFTSVNNTPRRLLVRLNADGSIDPGFNPLLGGPASGQARVDCIVLQPDGSILLGGSFTTVNGVASPGLARLAADGSFDPSLAIGSGVNGSVQAIALQPDGRILIGGGFSTFAGLPRRNLARLSPTGTPDTTGLVGTTGGVRRLVVLADGRFLAGGAFTAVGTLPVSHLARFHADGTHDPSFNVFVAGAVGGSTPGVYDLLVPGEGQILFGGAFSGVSQVTRRGVARLGSPFPAITRQPVDVFAGPGARVSLTVAATGEPVSFQWRRNGADLPGATRATLEIAGLQAATAGTYTARVSNRFGASFTAPATLALAAPPLPAFRSETVAGSPPFAGHLDQNGSAARFDRPTGLALDPAGNLYVGDTTTNFIRKILPDRAVITVASHAVIALAIDSAGQVYLADGRTRIMRLAPDGTLRAFAGTDRPGRIDGPAAAAQFDSPAGLALDRWGNLYVADTGNRTLRRVSAAGEVTTLAGAPGQPGTDDGLGPAARFSSPRGLALDLLGNLLVADGPALRRVSPAGEVRTLARGSGIIGVAVDAAGHIYFSDVNTHTIRRLAADGSDTLIAGATDSPGTDDGPGPLARFHAPWGLAVDPAGNLFLADNGNHAIRKLAPVSTPLAITLPPAATHAEASAPALLAVGASGAHLSYQWKRNGVAVPGATSAVLTLASASADLHMGAYTVVVTSGGSSVESGPALLTVSNPGSPGRLVNLATRGFIAPGEALTSGFVLRGEGARPVLVRGVGPTLLRFGLGGAFTDPQLTLAALDGSPVAGNDNWPESDRALVAATAAAGAFALDSPSQDAALLTVLRTAPSRAYTVRIAGATAAESGVALAEVYETDPGSSAVEFANVSTRGFVGTGNNALVPGFVIGGGGPLQLLIRAVGPGLAPFGVSGLLTDPQIAVTAHGETTPIASNDNWGGTPALSAAFAAAAAFALPPDSRDAALLLRLPPGAYTVTVSGAANSTGNVLVEIYDLR